MRADAAILRPLGSLLEPASVAIIGASDRNAATVETAESATRSWLVNPNRLEVLGRPCYPTVKLLPETPEAAILLVGPAYLEQAMSEALDSGVRALVIPGLGAEAGSGAETIRQQIVAMAERYGAAILGVNCMGYAQPGGPSLWFGSLPSTFQPGHVSIISQSGSVAEAFITAGLRIGFRTVISSGSETNRDAADFLAYFAADEGTKAIGIFLETIRRPKAFSEVLHRCREAGKPVVCLKVGRSTVASQVALTHTGALVGSSQGFSAYLNAHGAIEVRDILEMMETLELLGHSRWPRGLAIGAVSESGGEAALLADLAEDNRLSLPQLPDSARRELADKFPMLQLANNPIDAWAMGEVEPVYTHCFQVMQRASLYDAIVAQVDLTRYRSADDNEWCTLIVRSLATAARESRIVPIVVSANAIEPPQEIQRLAYAEDIALLRGIENSMRAIANVGRWSSYAKRLERPRSFRRSKRRLHPGVLSEFESATFLAQYGVPFATFRRASSSAEAADIAEQIGFPVAVKMDGPAHKSNLNGVALNVYSRDRAESEAERMGQAVIVAKQVPAGLEVICGMQRDPVYGPVVAVGFGGVAAEVNGMVAFSLAPLIPDEANRLAVAVTRLRGASQPFATAPLTELLEAISQAAVEHPEITSIDINPVVVSADGVIAVDALVAVGGNPKSKKSNRIPQGGS